ncbi:hypothetical protein D3C87_2003580 [compost metagenome]
MRRSAAGGSLLGTCQPGLAVVGLFPELFSAFFAPLGELSAFLRGEDDFLHLVFAFEASEPAASLDGHFTHGAWRLAFE